MTEGLKSPEQEHILKNVKINPDILDESLNYLSSREKFDYLKKAAKEVRQVMFARSLKKKITSIRHKDDEPEDDYSNARHLPRYIV